MSAQGFVFVHSADGLDHLRATREEEGTFRTDEEFQNKGLIASRVKKCRHMFTTIATLVLMLWRRGRCPQCCHADAGPNKEGDARRLRLMQDNQIPKVTTLLTTFLFTHAISKGKASKSFHYSSFLQQRREKKTAFGTSCTTEVYHTPYGRQMIAATAAIKVGVTAAASL